MARSGPAGFCRVNRCQAKTARHDEFLILGSGERAVKQSFSRKRVRRIAPASFSGFRLTMSQPLYRCSAERELFRSPFVSFVARRPVFVDITLIKRSH